MVPIKDDLDHEIVEAAQAELIENGTTIEFNSMDDSIETDKIHAGQGLDQRQL